MATRLPTTFKVPVKPDFPDVTFLRVSPGVIEGDFEVEITAYDVLRWERLHDDRSAWSHGDSPWGGPVAMPWILYYTSMNIMGHEFGRERHLPNAGGPSGFARYTCEYLAPIPVGALLTVNGEVTDKYSKRGRAYLEWRIEARLDGAVVQRHTKTWAFPALPNEIEGWPVRAGDGKPADEPAVGSIPPLTMAITLDRLVDFEGPIPINLHTDDAAAKRAGAPGPLAQGQLSYGLICRMLRDHFGAGFVVGGQTDVRFINSVYAGQTRTAKGEILGTENGRTRCRVWAENSDGVVVTAGTASALSA